MSQDEESSDRSLLLSELRHDVHASAEALARIRERVSFTLTQQHLAAIGSPMRPVARKPARKRWAAWGGLAAALMVGTALGAGGHAVVASYWLPQRQLATAPVQRAKAPAPALLRGSATANALPLPAPPPEEAEPVAEPAAPARSKARGAPAPSAEPGIAVELAKLEQARRALADGNATEALAVLARERELHPTSMLAQERDVLTVKALVGAGRHDEARAAGSSFLTRYPNSALAGAVQSALRAIP